MKTYLVRPIDANELKEKIFNNVYPVRDSFNSTDYGMFWTGGIEKIIDEQPTIDAVPVKRGMWTVIRLTNKDYDAKECSSCGSTFFDTKLWNYCPE